MTFPFLCVSRLEQKFDVASQMIDAVPGNGGVALCLCQDECALQYRLGVQREASRRPFGADAVTLHGCGDVGLKVRGMAADAGLAGVADRRGGLVDFLHHRSDQAGELRHRARRIALRKSI